MDLGLLYLQIVREWRMQSNTSMDSKFVIASSLSKRHMPGWGVMMQTNITKKIGQGRMTVFRCGRPGHWARECPFTRGDVEAGDRVGRDDCFRCGRPGHWARECPFPGAEPSSPLKISEEELSKYFSDADFPSTVSLSTQEDLDMVAAALQKEIPTKTEDVDTLRTMLFRLGSANGVPSSQQEIFNKIALQLSDISRDYLGLQDQYAHAARSLNKMETLQSSKSVFKKAYS